MECTIHVGQLGTVLLLLFTFRFTSSLADSGIDDNPSMTYPYDRFDEIEKHCGFILPPASELEPDDNRGDRMKKELSFMNGDWHQDTGKPPVVPFDYGDTKKYYGDGVPLNVVSFWVMDVNPLRRAKNAASVSGIMEIWISRSHSLFSYKPYEWSPTFSMSHGFSSLTIPFEGIYIESENNGGEYLMCFLGNATFPASQIYDFPANEYGLYNRKHKSSLVPDDQILLVLRYPKVFALQTRGITGEMTSLNQMSSITYFDKVHISSQLGFDSKYSFGSEELVAKACDPYPYPDKLVEKDIMMFQGDDYCERLYSFADRQVTNIIPSWEEDADRYGRNQTLGPFFLPRSNGTTDWNLHNTRLMIQNVRCEAGNEKYGTEIARVSAVLRVIQASEDAFFREEVRTGLSSTTISAEGIWHSSDGQLCMAGCLGPPNDNVDRCSTRICLYLPRTFSIKQRSLLYGTISSTNEANSYTSLKFEKVTLLKHIVDYYQWDRYLKWSYNYSKIEQAVALQKRLKPSKLVPFLRSSFLGYPSLKGTGTASVSFLADVLSNRLCAVPHTLPTEQTVKTSIEVEILSMGTLFGRYWSRPHQEKAEVGEPSQVSSDDTIPIAGQLNVISNELYNISLFFEGLYDPRIGCMYVIGCRNIPTSKNGGNLDGGMDCLIEATIQYPPGNARWLLNPKIKLTINSNRNSLDPLYLNPINLNTFLVSYSKKVDDQLFRKQFERVLRILLLSVAYLCTSSQSTYMKSGKHGGAYISVVMLGVMSLGYSIPLITGDEGLFRWKEFGSSRTQGGFDNLHWLQVLDTATKSLLVSVLLVTAGLAQRVWAIRGRLLGSADGRKVQIPSDKLVFLVTLTIHTIGFFLFHVISEVLMSPWNVSMKLLSLFGLLENYAGIIQDLFLLPQIIGNVFWNVQGQPLRKTFYLGFTMIRCFLHAYDYVRDPLSSNTQASDDEFQYLRTEFYTKFGNATAGLLVLVLAGIVSVQQRYEFKRSAQMLKLEESEDLTPKSELYELLLSK